MLAQVIPEFIEDLALGTSIHDVAARLSAQRGREIILVPYKMPADLWGAWVRGDIVDCIFYEENTPRFHQWHIIAHELGHIACNHLPGIQLSEVGTSPPSCRELQYLLRTAVRRDSREEREAEQFATELQNAIIQRAGLAALVGALPTAPGWPALLGHLGIG